MTCPNCERLKRRIEELETKISELRKENSMLKRRLALYENPNTPPSRHRYPKRRSSNRSGRRYPGRPKGHPGRTRPWSRPEVVKPPHQRRGVSVAVLL